MPSATPRWHFGPFMLDPANACLWHNAEAVALSPKVFDVLHYLVTHADRLVTKDELLDAVWPDTAVTDAVVRVAIGALRKALHDTGLSRFIATVPRRGYRFVAPVTVADAAESPTVSPTPQAFLPLALPSLLVGREAMLQDLGAAWAQARQGHRQVVWVTGEAGMGKTAVVEAFRAAVAMDPTVWLATGQCVEHYGTGEAYLPILEALGQLCRDAGGERMVTLLQQHAPTWLVQMPWLLNASHREQLRDELQGVTRERMLREFAEVVDALTAVTPLLLILEDLHWSDYATLDLLGLLARRRTPARLCVIGTYRPVETIVYHHPLRTMVQDLQRHGYARDLPLALLNAEAVATYLAGRFPRQQFPAVLVPWLHQRTDGQPLFLVTLVQALLERGVLYEHDGCWTVQEGLDALALQVPESLRQLLEQQTTRLPPEAQRVLEVASVAGVEFVAAAVAAGLEVAAATVEEHCEALVEQQLLRPLGVTTWPNGTVATRYAFVHALYQQVVYERLGAGRRVRLHQRLGGCLEAAYGVQAHEVAAELAEHFVRGQDTQRAVHYVHQAAENALHRYANQEAIRLLTRGLELLTTLPDTPERSQQELILQTTLGPALIATRGYAAPDVAQTYARARDLCRRMGDTPQLFVALRGLQTFYAVRAELQIAAELAEELLLLAQRQHDPTLLGFAHLSLGSTLFHSGAFVQARVHLEQGMGLNVPPSEHAPAFLYSHGAGVVCLSWAALTLWLLGYPDQALAEKPRGPHVGPAAGPAVQPGLCPGLGGLAASFAPRAAGHTRPGGGRDGFVYGARVCSAAGVWTAVARLGTRGATAGRRRYHPHTPGVDRLPGHGGSSGTAAVSRPAGGGAWAGETGRSGAGDAHGSVDGGETNGGKELQSGDPSAHRAVAVDTLLGTSQGGRSLLSSGPHGGSPPAGEITGAARRHEPESAVAAAGQAP